MKPHLCIAYRNTHISLLQEASNHLELNGLVALCGGAHHTYNSLLIQKWTRQKIMESELTSLLCLANNTIQQKVIQEGKEKLRNAMRGLVERMSDRLSCLICLGSTATDYIVCCLHCSHTYCLLCFLQFRNTFDRCAMCQTRFTKNTINDFVILRPHHKPAIARIRHKMDAIMVVIKSRRRKDVPCVVVTSESNYNFVYKALLKMNIEVIEWRNLDTLLGQFFHEQIDLLLYDAENRSYSVSDKAHIRLLLAFT